MSEYRATLNDIDAELAVNMLAEFVGDIEASIFVLDDVLSRAQAKKMDFMLFQNVMRMCIGNLVLTSFKASEIWQIYGIYAGLETKEKMRAVLKEASRRGMTHLRHKAIAHALDKETGKPLRPETLQELVADMWGEDVEGFVFWLRHPSDPKANTFSRALRLFREDILQQYPNVRITMPISTYRTPDGDVSL